MPENDHVIEEFRANEGRVGGYFEGRPLLLLHTHGRKTGLERVNPLAYLADGDRLVVFASKGGSPTHPDWYRNLEADQDVEVEVGTDRFPAKAALFASGPERDELYQRQVAVWPQFGGYETKTKGHRTIPVIVLKRVALHGEQARANG